MTNTTALLLQKYQFSATSTQQLPHQTWWPYFCSDTRSPKPLVHKTAMTNTVAVSSSKLITSMSQVVGRRGRDHWVFTNLIHFIPMRNFSHRKFKSLSTRKKPAATFTLYPSYWLIPNGGENIFSKEFFQGKNVHLPWVLECACVCKAHGSTVFLNLIQRTRHWARNDITLEDRRQALVSSVPAEGAMIPRNWPGRPDSGCRGRWLTAPCSADTAHTAGTPTPRSSACSRHWWWSSSLSCLCHEEKGNRSVLKSNGSTKWLCYNINLVGWKNHFILHLMGLRNCCILHLTGYKIASFYAWWVYKIASFYTWQFYQITSFYT